MEKSNATLRVGSVTAGITLVILGLLYLLHTFLNAIDLSLIIELWPLTLIGVGIEILVANTAKRNIVYDKWSVVIMACLIAFSMFMAIAQSYIHL